jgi:hypothetical protein
MDIKTNIVAFSAVQHELEDTHMGKWVMFHEDKLSGVYDSFDAAAADAVTRFGRGPYLIRQVGAQSVTLPASVMFRQIYA